MIGVEDVGGEVVHALETEPAFEEWDIVGARIDWERRYRLMRMHTALHLLYSVCREILGEKIFVVGSNVGEEKSRVDIHLDGAITGEPRPSFYAAHVTLVLERFLRHICARLGSG